MRTIVIGNTTPNTFMRPFVGTRAQITAANLPNGTLAIVTDEAESSIDLTVVYPVGSIYMNATDDTNPATLFGIGTWSLIDSKFLYGTNSLLSDLGETGGSTTATLVQNNLPTSLTGLTISAMTGSTSTESTDHTHTTVAVSNKTTGNVTGTGPSNHWYHRHNILTYQGSGVPIQNVYPNSLLASNKGAAASYGYAQNMTYELGSGEAGIPYLQYTDLQHTHDFGIPALTTGNQSEHSTHSHTVDVDSQTINLTNVGSGTSFSILPTYRKVAIWFRQS